MTFQRWLMKKMKVLLLAGVITSYAMVFVSSLKGELNTLPFIINIESPIFALWKFEIILMAITRLKRKGRRNKLKARIRAQKMKIEGFSPVLKNVDIDKIRNIFRSWPARQGSWAPSWHVMEMGRDTTQTKWVLISWAEAFSRSIEVVARRS